MNMNILCKIAYFEFKSLLWIYRSLLIESDYALIVNVVHNKFCS